MPEPVGNEIPAKREELEAVIVPMLAFGRSGAGYGAGYYDRFFSKFPDAKIIGIAFSCQEMKSIECGSFDKKMDIIIAEKEIIETG